MALTYYDTLGEAPEADALTLRQAYHRRSWLLHPDRHQGASPAVREAADRAMAELNRAWTVLRDAESRRLYDVSLSNQPVSVTAAIAEVPVPARRVTTSRWWRDPAPAPSGFVAFA